MFDFTLSSESPIAAGMYINGQWLARGSAPASLEVENPANETVIATITDGSDTDAAEALDAARRAFAGWAGRPAVERGRLVTALADEVQTQRDHLARLVTLEQGKPLAHAKQEIDAG
ncbi:MAG: aldehyde dehydrogenase family protein, partial [Pseudomonadota bacterium]